MPRHVIKGDEIIVIAGSDKGKTGRILKVFPSEEKVLVEGINVRTCHLKPTQQNPKGGILKKEMPIHISNVTPIADGKTTRVRFNVDSKGRKARVAARDGSELHVLRAHDKGDS